MKYKQGDRVFAKLKGYPHWPARVEELLDPGKLKYKVFFYGTYEFGHIVEKDLFLYDEFKDKYAKNNSRRGFNEGLHQIIHEPGVKGRKELIISLNRGKKRKHEEETVKPKPKQTFKHTPFKFKVAIKSNNKVESDSEESGIISDTEMEENIEDSVNHELDIKSEPDENQNSAKMENKNLKKVPKKRSPKVNKAQAKMVEQELSALEKLHRQNIADNKAMLAKLMEDLKHMAPLPVKPQKAKQESTKREKKPNRFTSLSYDPPVTRARRGSVSSSGFSSAPASPEHKLPTFEEEDDTPVPAPRPRRSLPVERVIKSVDQVTDEDIEMVAVTVRDKRYDTVYGSTCHQCRQKTIDTKTICRDEDCFGVRGQFCGPCLRNRYGEDVKIALKDPNWICPPCRGICNCSFCRRKSGRSCTGILIHLAREYGYDNVNDYLQSLRKKVRDEEDSSGAGDAESEVSEEKESEDAEETQGEDVPCKEEQEENEDNEVKVKLEAEEDAVKVKEEVITSD